MSRRRIHPIADNQPEERLPTSSFGKMIHNYITNPRKPVAFNLQDQLKTCLALPLVSVVILAATTPLTVFSFLLTGDDTEATNKLASIAKNSLVSLIKSPFILLSAPIRAIHTKMNGGNLEDVSIVSDLRVTPTEHRITPEYVMPERQPTEETQIDIIDVATRDAMREEQENEVWNQIRAREAATAAMREEQEGEVLNRMMAEQMQDRERRRNGTLPVAYDDIINLSSATQEETSLIDPPAYYENLPTYAVATSGTQNNIAEENAPHPNTPPPDYEETQHLESTIRRRPTEPTAVNPLQQRNNPRAS